MIRMAKQSERRPRFLLPDGFDATAIVGPLKADAARWLVSAVLGKAASNDVDLRGFAVLSSAILRRVMGRDHARIVAVLLDAGVLERLPYREGRSYGYRLAADYPAGRPRWVPVTNPVMLDRIKRERERYQAEQAKLWLPIHDALDEAQQALTVMPAVHAAVESLPKEKKLCQRVHVGRLQRHELPFSISSTHRVFNAMSGVKSDLREFLRLDGEPIGCIDICNSQPALLGNLLVHGFPHEWGKRLRNIKIHLRALAPASPSPSLAPVPAASSSSFVSSAVSGVLYDELAERFDNNREFVKKRFLVDVLAKKGNYPSDVEDEFKRRFPEAWETIQGINAGSHCNLIRLLQQVEAWLVIERVSPELVDRMPIATLHDAIYSRQKDLGEVEEAFARVFDETGWELSLKRELA